MTPSDRIQAGRYWAAKHAPYLAAGLWRLRLRESAGIGTMAVSMDWVVHYDPAAVVLWTTQQTGSVIAHELWHVVRQHHRRAQAIGAAPEAWNIAADAEINDGLSAPPWLLPDGCVLPSSLGREDGLLAEEYYAAQAAAAQPQAGHGSGSGSDGVRRRWETNDDAPSAPTVAEQTAIARQVATRMREAGVGSDGQRRWADGVMAVAQPDWRRELPASVRGALVRAGASDWTWSRLPRRDTVGMRPGSCARSPRVAVILDSSGSMEPDTLGGVLAVLAGICREAGATQYVVCDDRVHAVGRTHTGRINLAGGGGTDMRVGIATAVASRPDCIVTITDGHTPWPDQAPAAQHICVLVGDGEGPSWGRTISALASSAAETKNKNKKK